MYSLTFNKNMKKTMTTYEIVSELLADEYANWSRAGAEALAVNLQEIEESLDEEMKFDKVAIRCDYSQHISLQYWIADHYGEPLAEAMKSAGIDLDGEEDEEEIDDLIRSHIQDHGNLFEFNGGIIVSNF
jgi:hypothetical protein